MNLYCSGYCDKHELIVQFCWTYRDKQPRLKYMMTVEPDIHACEHDLERSKSDVWKFDNV
jgi:hypothetical protein